jgi:hypothetical protein
MPYMKKAPFSLKHLSLTYKEKDAFIIIIGVSISCLSYN